MTTATDKTGSLRQALEQRIIHGLSCEWEVALWVLPETYRNELRKPLFSLRDMRRHLGEWDPEKREIALARQFIMEHPWHAVRDVLHHEMAHQLAHEIMGGLRETSHGAAFQKACHLLRIEPDATGRYEKIETVADSGASDAILVKIKKLFALAESPNPHEAEAAMLKAHQLIARYNIDLLALNQNRRFVSRLVGRPALRHTRDSYDLANLIQDFYFVQGIWVPIYLMDKGKMGRVLELSGTTANVEMAAYVFDYICHFIDGQWRLFNGRKGHGLRRKVDFAVGVLDGFRRKLEPTQKTRSNQTQVRSLVSLKDPMLDKYLKYKYPHTKSFRTQGAGRDPDILRAGIAAGETLVIAKGVTETGGRGKLIGNE
jgi:hypothetical protein